MDKLEALRYFCTASETLNFRAAAEQLSVSPQVVTRIIAELETALGERLFVRNTRSVRLTPFGEQFLPNALQLLSSSEQLFASKIDENALQGVVKITLPPLPQQEQILFKLLTALSPYPDLTIEWFVSLDKYKTIEDQIDIGIRIGREPEEDWVAYKICDIQEKIVAAPSLIKRLGYPRNLQDLAQNYPLSGLFNPKLKRVWHWKINEEQHFTPSQLRFTTTDIICELQASLSGKTCGQILDILCQPYIEQGKLIELFPEIPKLDWHLYLYRPYQNIVSARVRFVFGELRKILTEIFA